MAEREGKNWSLYPFSDNRAEMEARKMIEYRRAC